MKWNLGRVLQVVMLLRSHKWGMQLRQIVASYELPFTHLAESDLGMLLPPVLQSGLRCAKVVNDLKTGSSATWHNLRLLEPTLRGLADAEKFHPSRPEAVLPSCRRGPSNFLSHQL